MFKILKMKPSDLDEPINMVLSKMASANPGTEDYQKLTDDLQRLILLRVEERKSRISPDTIIIVAGNLLGILIIVAYEQRHVMASRGLGFLLRTKHG